MGWWNDIGRVLSLKENTVMEDEPVLLRCETCDKTGSERLTKDGGAESEGDSVRVEVSLGDLFVQASQVFWVEGAGRRVMADSAPGFQEGEVVGPESDDQARPHDGATKILLLLEAVTIVVARHTLAEHQQTPKTSSTKTP